MGERRPGRHGGIDHGGDGGVVEIGGQRRAQRAPRNGALGEGSVGRVRCAEEDAGSVGGAADTVDSWNQGQLAGAAVVRSPGERFDDGMESGGGDVDEDFIGGGNGVGEGFVTGRLIVGMDDGGVHERVSRKYCSGFCARRNRCRSTVPNWLKLGIWPKNGWTRKRRRGNGLMQSGRD